LDFALQFLSNHPAVASESFVWRARDLTGNPVKKLGKIEYTYISGAAFDPPISPETPQPPQPSYAAFEFRYQPCCRHSSGNGVEVRAPVLILASWFSQGTKKRA
jgi:hypothetical protein